MLQLKAQLAEPQMLESWHNRKGDFAKIYLISDKRNKNGWRVTWESIKKNAHDFAGRPGIIYSKCEDGKCDLDHTDGQTYESNLEIQEPFRETTLREISFDEDEHKAYAIHEIHTPSVAKKLHCGELKFVSPAIWPIVGQYKILGKMPNGNLKIDVWGWKALHSAFVNDPAFGDEARVVAMCHDSGSKCRMQMLKASTDLEPLQEIPLLVKHKGHHTFVSASKCVYNLIQSKLEHGIIVDESALQDAQNQCGAKKAVCNCKNTLAAKIAKLELLVKIRALEAAVGGEQKGRWITMPNGQAVFIPDGQDAAETIYNHFLDKKTTKPKKEKSKKNNDKTTVKNADTYKHNVQITFGGVSDADQENMMHFRNAWNSLNQDFVKNVNTLEIGGTLDLNTLGSFYSSDWLVEISIHSIPNDPVYEGKGDLEKKYLGVLIHEVGHSIFHKASFSQQKEFYNLIQDTELSDYSTEWRDEITDADLSTGRLTQSKLTFANETFAEFQMMANGVTPIGGHKESFKVVKAAYEKVFGKFEKALAAKADGDGKSYTTRLQISKTIDSVYVYEKGVLVKHYLAMHKKSAKARLAARIRLLATAVRLGKLEAAEDGKGRWITMPNGEPVHIDDGADVGESIREHFKDKKSTKPRSRPAGSPQSDKESYKIANDISNQDTREKAISKVVDGLSDEYLRTKMDGYNEQVLFDSDKVNPGDEVKMREYLKERLEYPYDERSHDELLKDVLFETDGYKAYVKKTTNDAKKFYKQQHENANYFFRGTDNKELSKISKDLLMGVGRKKDEWGNFVSFTTNSTTAFRFADSGNTTGRDSVVLQFAKADLDDKLSHAGYEFTETVHNSKEHDEPQGMHDLWQEEHRMPLGGTSIKGMDVKIHVLVRTEDKLLDKRGPDGNFVQQTVIPYTEKERKAFEKRYGEIGKVVWHDKDEGWDEVF